ncbi:MAG: DNA-processing protein DprA [Nocardioidaceae bacterium]
MSGATPVDDRERWARAILSWVAEPGDADACRLVRDFSAAALLDRLRAGSLASAKAGGWAERLVAARPDELSRAAERVEARYVCPGDHEWPVSLDDLRRFEDATGERRAGSPFGLWVRGAARFDDACARAVSVVGARAATAYGEHVAGDLAGGCVRHGLAVVSGGAYGIDAAAHRGALVMGGVTVAVLAGGIDRVYPAGHTELLRQIADVGLLVSEGGPGCAPSRSRFLVRNRLIAAVSQGTVVVEAALRSGSLNTARWARELGRGVMGVPGPVTSMMSSGVHELLRNPEVLLVTDSREVLEHVSPVGQGLAPVKRAPVESADLLDEHLRRLLDAVPKRRPASVASIAVTAGLPRSEVQSGLPQLVRLGHVRQVAGRWMLVT